MIGRVCVIAIVSLLILLQEIAGQFELCRPIGQLSYDIFISQIPESMAFGDVIGQVEVEGNSTQVELSSIETNFLKFNNISRNIYVIGQLDTETKDEHKITVTCRIITNPLGPIDITVHVLLTDVNEFSPQFSQDSYDVTVREDAIVGSVIYRSIYATDADRDNSYVSYAIVHGAYSNYFKIELPATPNLALNTRLDFESVREMVIQITATDFPVNLKDVRLTSTATVTIHIQDVDDKNPVFTQSVYSTSILENVAVGSYINVSPKIRAADQDTLNDSVSYSLLFADSRFEVNSSTCEIRVAEALVAGSYEIIIQAQQTNDPERYATSKLIITAQQTTNRPPRFLQPVYQIDILENTPLHQTVLTVSAVDEDIGTTLSYTMDSNKYFTVGSSGAIFLMNPLDYEQEQEISLTVRTTDGVNMAAVQITAHVKDVNDNNPTIVNAGQPISASRSDKSPIVVIKAEDKDAGTTFTFRLLGYNSLFSINQRGELTISGSPGSLTQERYDLIVLVSDSGNPPRESSSLIEIVFPSIPSGTDPPISTGTSSSGGKSTNSPPTDVKTTGNGNDMTSTLNPVDSSTVKDPSPVVLAGTGQTLLYVFGILSAVFIIVIIVLMVYIIKNRQRFSRQLDKARAHTTLDPKGLAYKTNGVVSLGYECEESSDGATTIQENPIGEANEDGIPNFVYQTAESSESDRSVHEIEIETAVIPYDYSTNDKYSKGGTGFPNGGVTTFRDESSDDSLTSDSTGNSSKNLVPKGSQGKNSRLAKKQLSWGDVSEKPTLKSQKTLQDNVTDEKPEITVYF